MTFRELYVKEMDEITFSEGFQIRTANLMKQKAEGKDEKIKKKRRHHKDFFMMRLLFHLFSCNDIPG